MLHHPHLHFGLLFDDVIIYLYYLQMVKALYTTLFAFFLLIPFSGMAQEEDFDQFLSEKPQKLEITDEMKEAERSYNEKILEQIAIHRKNGFEIYKEDRVALIAGQDRSVYITLEEGQWYHFVYVGDPHAGKISVNLFLEGVGDFVNDRLKPQQDGEFWSEFSFLCPQTGNYELSFFQRCPISRPLSYLTVFRRTSSAAGNL